MTYGPYELPNYHKAGDVVWASAYQYNTPKTGLALRQLPVKGMLAASKYGVFADRGDASPRYFVPLRKGSDTELAWSKAIPARNRDISDTEQEAVAAYNKRVRDEIEWSRARIAQMEKDLLPETERNEENDHG